MTFPTILSIFYVGVATGFLLALLARNLVRRLLRPSASPPPPNPLKGTS